jgi:peptidoglycan/xylan/chitin deacetylase (PgdA/CDA1 family)
MMNLRIKSIIKSFICSLVYTSGGLYVYKRLHSNNRLIILMYHKINYENDVLGLTINPVFFDRQIQYLTNQYSILPMSEALYRLKSGTLDRNTVVITFDDGYRDNYTIAYPILQRYQAPATIFITHDAVESGTFGWHRFDTSIMMSQQNELDLEKFGLRKYLLARNIDRGKAVVELHSKMKKMPDTDRRAVEKYVLNVLGDPVGNERIMLCWHEIREMQQSGLITIGAHTLTHPILTQISKDSALEEIRDCKKYIEKEIGSSVDFFAYPNGRAVDFDNAIIEMVKGSGYQAACSTIPPGHFSEINMFALQRLDVTHGICQGAKGGYCEEMFAIKLSGMLDGILFKL